MQAFIILSIYIVLIKIIIKVCMNIHILAIDEMININGRLIIHGFDEMIQKSQQSSLSIKK